MCERQQRWMVNQRSSKNLMYLWDIISPDKKSRFLSVYCATFAKRLGSGYQADAMIHTAMLVAMPEIRGAFKFESEIGELCFEPVMAFHSRVGPFSK